MSFSVFYCDSAQHVVITDATIPYVDSKSQAGDWPDQSFTHLLFTAITDREVEPQGHSGSALKELFLKKTANFSILLKIFKIEMIVRK